MIIDFIHLSRFARERICCYLECETTTEMRKVCKSVKAIVDEHVLRTQTRDLSFSLEGEDNEVQLIIYVFDWWDCSMWKNCINSALGILKIKGSVTYAACLMPTYGPLVVTIELCGMRLLLEYLNPVLRAIIIEDFQISNYSSAIIRMLANFLEGRVIKNIGIKPHEILDLSPCLVLIEQVKPDHVIYTSKKRGLTRNMVKSLFIYHEYTNNENTSHPDLVSIIISLLNRRCEKLQLRDRCSNAVVSPSDTERLLQFLHHSEKKCYLQWQPTTEAMNKQIGIYNASIGYWASVTHLDCFLDCETIVEIRKVCKSAKEIVDAYIIRTQTCELNRLRSEDGEDNKVKLIIAYDHWWDRSMWKNFIISAFDMLGVNGSVINSDDFTDNRCMQIMLFVTSTLNGMRLLLEYLKLILGNQNIDLLSISNYTPEITRIYMNFLERKRVVNLTVAPEKNLDLTPYVDLIEKVKPDRVNYSSKNRGKLTREIMEILLRIADSVKSLFIYHEHSDHVDENPSHLDNVQIICSLMRRKCEKIVFRDCCQNNAISLSDAEKLLRILHHSDKKLEIRCLMSPDAIDTMIGFYKVKKLNNRFIWVKHIEV